MMSVQEILQQREGKKKTQWPGLNPAKRAPEKRVHDLRGVYLDYDDMTAHLEAESCIACKKPVCE